MIEIRNTYLYEIDAFRLDILDPNGKTSYTWNGKSYKTTEAYECLINNKKIFVDGEKYIEQILIRYEE